MAATAEETIQSGATQTVDLSQPVGPQVNEDGSNKVDVKITSADPTTIKLDQKEIPGLPSDPFERFKQIVTEKKEVKKDEKEGKEKGTGEEGKPGEQSDKSKPDDSEYKKEADGDVPPTARYKPKPKLEDQLKEEDLTGIDKESFPILRKMDKDAREWVKARIRENTELKEKLKQSPNNLPANWFDHEEAYILHPEFRKNIALVGQVTKEVNYWKEQLVKVRKGEKWHDLTATKDGLVTEEMLPDVNAEDELQSRIREGERLYREYNAQAYNIKSLFEQQRNQSQQVIKAIEEKFFPQYREDKKFDENKYVKQMRSTLQQFNQGNNILAGFLTNLYRFALERCDELAERENEQKDKVEQEKERVKAGPTSSEIQGGKTKPLTEEEKPFDFSAFEKIKKGY